MFKHSFSRIRVNTLLKSVILFFLLCVATSNSAQAGYDDLNLENADAKYRYQRAINRVTQPYVEDGVDDWVQFFKYLCRYDELLHSDQPSPSSIAKELGEMRHFGGLNEQSPLFNLVEELEHFYTNIKKFVKRSSEARAREPQLIAEKELAEDIEANYPEDLPNQETIEKEHLLSKTNEDNVQIQKKFEQRSFNGDKESARSFKNLKINGSQIHL